MENQTVYEFAYFQLKADADESAFLAVSETFKRDFLEKQEGLVDRTLLRSENGTWCVLAIWATEENAASVMKNMETSDISQEYLSFMDFATVKIDHFTVVQN